MNSAVANAARRDSSSMSTVVGVTKAMTKDRTASVHWDKVNVVGLV